MLKQCYVQLRQAEMRILKLTGVDEQGQPVTEPFDHTATSEAAALDTKPKRKSRAGDAELPF